MARRSAASRSAASLSGSSVGVVTAAGGNASGAGVGRSATGGICSGTGAVVAAAGIGTVGTLGGAATFGVTLTMAGAGAVASLAAGVGFEVGRPRVHHAVVPAIAMVMPIKLSASQTAERLRGCGDPVALMLERATTASLKDVRSGIFTFVVAAGGGGGGGGGGGAANSSGVPHLAQNCAPARFKCPQAEQETPAISGSCEPAAASPTDCPQPLQNFAPSRLFVPQFEQVVVMALLVVLFARYGYGGLWDFATALRSFWRAFL